MRYSDQNNEDLNDQNDLSSCDGGEVDKKHYRRSRPFRSMRRKANKSSGAGPGVGMAGRRKRRWAW